MEEQILVVKTSLFHQIGQFQGFCDEVDKYVPVLLAPENILVVSRSLAEKDPTYKQLIPYLLFCYQPPSGEMELFRYVRGKGTGESRLQSKHSIGVGGHLNSHDVGDVNEGISRDVYRQGLLRELHEEVEIDTPYTERCVGLINDDSTEVGSVHLGIVHRFDVAEPQIRSKEPDLLESGFLPISQLFADLTKLETWSSICLRALLGDVRVTYTLEGGNGKIS